ncbi:hypothetical protein G6O69_20690 [Pseudenhygromyxa sp. WMMC2535]|uniref:hypothetical protein n=1 Tax=Pseudenhygromyxa sp. WMMC2535 TaxID=2712867 RepID=UPI0015536F82|nr:hypothetical protein [Pseudenhygromyxa sp. WMMC2535]NVB40272.1 hypothetical protein [Pseudenhygromyxa sp. WMMC2535]
MRIAAASALSLSLSLALACGGAQGEDQGEDESEGHSAGTVDEGGASEGESAEAGGTDTLGESGSEDSGEATETGETGETGEAEPTCNCHVELCERPYDEVVFAGTHNSYSATGEGYIAVAANQTYGVAQQLADGVRLLMLDTVYADDDSGAILLCHGSCNFGSTVHAEVLADIVSFMTENPGEIVTIIYEDDVSAEDLALDFAATGAIDLVYTHVGGEPWPTLAEMVAADTRLVITAEQGGPPPDWHHHVWDLAWDTPYGPMDPDALSCALNRGSSDNDLFLVNHWVNSPFGTPSVDNATIVNEYDVLLERAQACWAAWEHPTNFVAVDFYDRGDLIAVVDTLNGF